MYPNEITNIHIELTDRCQASCPMCARNINGGREREFVGKNDITLEKFKQWFPESFLKNIKHFYSCGNYGDPIIAQDCLEIYSYLRSINPFCHLGMHTNGSARSTGWWESLAKVFSGSHMITFGIDGFEKSHQLYRRGTSWKKIVENAKAFISAGGRAEVDCLVFKHNEHELKEFEKFIMDTGFTRINFKYTRRFYDMEKFPVENVQGNFEYYLEPAVHESYVNVLPLKKISEDIKIWEDMVKKSNILPKCIDRNEIYIDARGNVFPCCWIGSDWVEQPIVEKMPIQKLRNIVVDDTKSKFKNIGIPNLNDMKITDIDWDNLDQWIKENKPWTCVKNCNEWI